MEAIPSYHTQLLFGIAPAAPQPEVMVVTRRQALRALHEAGLLPAINEAIDGLDEPERGRARIDWETAGEFRRDFPLLLQLAAAIGLTEAHVDDLFTAAKAVT